MLQTYVPGPESEYVGRMKRCGIDYVLKLMMRIRRTKMSTAMVTVEPEYKGDMSYSSINKEGGTYHSPSPPELLCQASVVRWSVLTPSCRGPCQALLGVRCGRRVRR